MFNAGVNDDISWVHKDNSYIIQFFRNTPHTDKASVSGFHTNIFNSLSDEITQRSILMLSTFLHINNTFEGNFILYVKPIYNIKYLIHVGKVSFFKQQSYLWNILANVVKSKEIWNQMVIGNNNSSVYHYLPFTEISYKSLHIASHGNDCVFISSCSSYWLNHSLLLNCKPKAKFICSQIPKTSFCVGGLIYN